jgi:membrane protein required for colicin V production
VKAEGLKPKAESLRHSALDIQHLAFLNPKQMIIDSAFLIEMVIAVYKGFSKGIVIGIFSLIAFIIGLAAALKLSAAAAHYLQTSSGITARWMPFLAFMLVFLLVVLLVNLGARIIKKTVRMAMLGWLDRLAGILLYIIIYTIIFSVLLFFAEKMAFLKRETIQDSKVYGFVSPWGPAVIDNLGKIIPAFRDMFTQLESFFQNLSDKLPM